ncbi:MAG: ketoacyl-ACP synthase III [Actinobacteria bacterium]|nr:ketoacyl-ACP synthase III [Actinomycetota bacterium]
MAGTGVALPDRVVPNSFFEGLVETSDQWIVERTGIRERRFAAEGQATSHLASAAGRRALEAAGLAPEQVDLLIVATLTPDRPLPSAAVMVQAALGLSCPAFDVNAACAGFSYATAVGTSMIESGGAENALVIGAEVLSRVLNLTDRTTCVLFGDGAGAAVLIPSDEPGVLASALHADGTKADLLTIPAGGTERPLSPERIAAHEGTIHMESGREVFRRAVTDMTSTCRDLLDKAGLSPDDVDLLIPHQANARIVASVGQRLGIPPERSVLDMEEVGNTSAASIPIALDRAWRAGRIHPGDVVLLASFGAGLTWGATLVRWTAPAPRA